MFGAATFSAVVAVFSYGLAHFLLALGLNKRVYNHVPGECSMVGAFDDGVFGFETSFDGTLFMTAGYCSSNCSSSHRGRILTYSVDNKSAWELAIEGSSLHLNPSGLSLSPSKNKIHLMAIHKDEKRTSVEIFSYTCERPSLLHLRTVRSKLLHNLVDVAAVDRTRFFASSLTYTKHRWSSMAERLLGLPTGSVLFFDGKETRKVGRLATPTGIVYDKFRSLLFVASLSSESLYVYNVREDFNITLNKVVPLQCAPYSLWRDIDNSLLTACHPVKLRYFTHLYNRDEYFAPSQILRIHYRPKEGEESPLSQVYANDGATVSAAHAAVRAGKTLLIGAHSGMLSCDLPMS